jgi:hypothetical protein
VSTRQWQLEGDLRQAFENYNGGTVSGPWDKLIEQLAAVIQTGSLDLATSARINLLLERTQGGTAPDSCGTCDCPYPDQVHR